MRKLIFILSAAVLLSSCKKTSNRTGNNCGTQEVTKSYFPLTPGDSWESKPITVSGDVEQVETEVLSNTLTVAGKAFYAFQYTYIVNGVRDVDPEYEYYSYYNDEVLYHDPNIGSVETLLKVNAPVATVWSDTVHDGSVHLRTERKIEEKNSTRTVNGITYQQVIHVLEKIFQDQDTNGSYETLNVTYDVFYAKGVGIIEVKMDGDVDPYSVLQCFTIQ